MGKRKGIRMKQVFELGLPDLLYFVKESCHVNLHDSLPILKTLSDEVSRSHSHHCDFPEELPKFVKKFIKNLQLHLALEEQNLFPHLETGHSRNGAATIIHLEDDHNRMKSDLLKLRQMTDNYRPPEFFDVKGLRFYSLLKEMDRIILNHIQIEDHILFPMVKRIS